MFAKTNSSLLILLIAQAGDAMMVDGYENESESKESNDSNKAVCVYTSLSCELQWTVSLLRLNPNHWILSDGQQHSSATH